MRLNFFDAQLRLTPKYFISSVGLRVTFFEREYFLPGVIINDDLVVQFRQTLSIPDTYFETSEVILYVELIAALNDERSETRTIGLGSIVVPTDRDERRLINVTLSSRNLEIVMAKLQVSMTMDHILCTSCDMSDWDKEFALRLSSLENQLAPDSSSVTSSNRAPFYYCDKENNFSFSFSRVSNLTYGSCHQVGTTIQPNESYAALTDKIRCQLSAIRKECFIENFDNSIPEISTTDQHIDRDGIQVPRKLLSERTVIKSDLTTTLLPLTSKRHSGIEKKYDGESVGEIVNNEKRNEFAPSSNNCTIAMKVNEHQLFKRRLYNSNCRHLELEKGSQIGQRGQIIEEVDNEINVEQKNEQDGDVTFAVADATKYGKRCKNQVKKNIAEKQNHDGCTESLLEKQSIDSSANVISNDLEYIMRDDVVPAPQLFKRSVAKGIDFSQISSIHSTGTSVRERRRKFKGSSSSHSQTSGASGCQHQSVRSEDKSSNNFAVSSISIREIIDDLGLKPRSDHDENLEGLDRNRGASDNTVVSKRFNVSNNLNRIGCQAHSNLKSTGRINSCGSTSNRINHAIRRILEGHDFDTISAQHVRLESAEKRRSLALQATKSRAQCMSSKSTSKAKAIKEAVSLSCKVFDKLRNDFDRKHEVNNRNQATSNVSASLGKNGLCNFVRARSMDSHMGINRSRGRSSTGLAVGRRNSKFQVIAQDIMRNDMRLSGSLKRSESPGGSLPYSDLRRRSRSTGHFLRSQNYIACTLRSQREPADADRIEDVLRRTRSVVDSKESRGVPYSIIDEEGVKDRGRARERNTALAGNQRSAHALQRRTTVQSNSYDQLLSAWPTRKDTTVNMMKPIKIDIVSGPLITDIVPPKDDVVDSVKVLRRARSASQREKIPFSYAPPSDTNNQGCGFPSSRRGRSAYTHRGPATSLLDPCSSASQILLVTLVLERIDAIKNKISAAPSVEAKKMLRMIEKLLSLVMSLTSTSRIQDGLTVKCALIDEKSNDENKSESIYVDKKNDDDLDDDDSNDNDVRRKFDLEEGELVCETSSEKIVTQTLSETLLTSLDTPSDSIALYHSLSSLKKSRQNHSVPLPISLSQSLSQSVSVRKAEIESESSSSYTTHRSEQVEDDDEVRMDSDDDYDHDRGESERIRRADSPEIRYSKQVQSNLRPLKHSIDINERSQRNKMCIEDEKEGMKCHPSPSTFSSSSSSLRVSTLANIISDDIDEVTSAIGNLQSRIDNYLGTVLSPRTKHIKKFEESDIAKGIKGRHDKQSKGKGVPGIARQSVESLRPSVTIWDTECNDDSDSDSESECCYNERKRDCDDGNDNKKEDYCNNNKNEDKSNSSLKGESPYQLEFGSCSQTYPNEVFGRDVGISCSSSSNRNSNSSRNSDSSNSKKSSDNTSRNSNNSSSDSSSSNSNSNSNSTSGNSSNCCSNSHNSKSNKTGAKHTEDMRTNSLCGLDNDSSNGSHHNSRHNSEHYKDGKKHYIENGNSSIDGRFMGYPQERNSNELIKYTKINIKTDESCYTESSTAESDDDDSIDNFDLQRAFAVDDITLSTESTYDGNAIFFSPRAR